ncbi:hypothetical protein Aph01nite_43140 [Acrocarpospora phusangensis]|uniref:Uncharacterized protein n=1 Tax=Acrocarpospora phusangensis TaxID=1070424 RepID=A0A919QE11_9ACTN|nr:hypothetical protein [Acrocarpospora phusangensis]GIH26004.1 hypothetical protein Aph01nite_43140 [Acrocarpospora phusangensis]
MTALPDLAAVEHPAPRAPAATPGPEAGASVSVPGLPGETSPSPGHPSVEEVLGSLAVAWLNELWTVEFDVALIALSHRSYSGDPEAMWADFEEFASAVYLRNGVDNGTVHWSQVDDELACSEPSAAAFNIACDRVSEAARVLLCGRRTR